MNYRTPILNAEEATLWEEKLLQNDETKVWQAMNAAGRGAGKKILQDFTEISSLPESPKILVLAGKGHNAGDALLAAEQILEMHPEGEVSILFALGKEGLKPLVAKALALLEKRERVSLFDAKKGIYGELLQQPFDFVIDGIFGMSFTPPVEEPVLTILEAINKNEQISLRAAIDIPSGLSDNLPAMVFKANFTYATGIAKTPLFRPENTEYTGRIRMVDIGFFEEDYSGGFSSNQHILNETILDPLRQLRPSTVNKKNFGHLFIVSGSTTMPGALLMSIQAALRSGVGLITVFTPESIATTLATSVPEAMWVPCPETSAGTLSSKSLALVKEKSKNATALLTGPGLGREPETIDLVSKLLKTIASPVLLDADALQIDTVQAASSRNSEFGPVLATPHQGEFMRLNKSENQPYNKMHLLNFCQRARITTLLKGAITRICNGRTTTCSTFGGPVLARGGTGDILSGLAAGLLAQKPEETPELILGQAAVWHGLAADLLARQQGQAATATTDLLPFLSEALREECTGCS